MRILVLLCFCLTTLALGQAKITVKDIMFREDDYAVPIDMQTPVRPPTLRISSLLKNEGKTTAKKLKIRMTWMDQDGRQLRQDTEDLPEIKAGKEFLYWAPEFINLGRQLVTARVEILEGDTVIASRFERE